MRGKKKQQKRKGRIYGRPGFLRRKRPVYARIIVDPRRFTKLLDANIGIHQDQRDRAAAPMHFTKDMKIFGKVKENVWNEKEQTYDVTKSLVGFCEDDFDEYKKTRKKNPETGNYESVYVIDAETGENVPNMDRMLVIRTFEDIKGDPGKFIGSLEEIIPEEISLSDSAGEPRFEFKIIMEGRKNTMYTLKGDPRRTPHKWGGKLYSFWLDLEKEIKIPRKRGRPKIEKKRFLKGFLLDEKRFTPGKDFKIFRRVAGGKKETLGYINHKVAHFGGKYKIDVFDQELANSKHFGQMIALFAASIKYHEQLEDIVRERMNYIWNGGEYELSKKTRRLCGNPRGFKKY